jgi:hypothetical protein
MKKKSMLVLLIILNALLIYGETLQEILNQIVENQNKIKTEVSVGSLIINIYDENNKKMQSNVQDLTLYLKQPNKIKVIVKSQTDSSGMTLVQIGDNYVQKIHATNQIIRKKSSENSDLFKKYLGLGIDKILKGFNIKDIKLLANNIDEYELVPINSLNSINKYLLRIDKNIKMNTYETFFYNEKQTVEIFKEYEKIDNIQALKKMTVITGSNSMKVETIFLYKTINLNTQILDKEFDL